MFKDNTDFYPTPSNLIDKMLSGIDFTLVQTILEPSAGKGDIVDAIANKFKHVTYNRNYTGDVDTIEINESLQHILRGKDYRVVHDDFLTYDTYKQ